VLGDVLLRRAEGVGQLPDGGRAVTEVLMDREQRWTRAATAPCTSCAAVCPFAAAGG